jgi:alpha-D-ribose 1-methylphosphonate 5-triphosphate diphosphatase PhnM
MSARIQITNARIATADAVVEGGLVTDSGAIREDCGPIAPGLRADLVRAPWIGETPSVVSFWRDGKRVA